MINDRRENLIYMYTIIYCITMYRNDQKNNVNIIEHPKMYIKNIPINLIVMMKLVIIYYFQALILDFIKNIICCVFNVLMFLWYNKQFTET